MKLVIAKLAAILNWTGNFTTPESRPGKGANKLQYLLIVLGLMFFPVALNVMRLLDSY